MNYATQQDVLDFVEDNNVKFVRFAFTDIFGAQKNIAVLAGDLPKALRTGSASTAAPCRALCRWKRATWSCGPTCPP